MNTGPNYREQNSCNNCKHAKHGHDGDHACDLLKTFRDQIDWEDETNPIKKHYCSVDWWMEHNVSASGFCDAWEAKP